MVKLPKNFNTVNRKFYKYQLESFIFCIKRKNSGLLLDMGLGKTFVAINVARFFLQKKRVTKVLIVAPTGVLLSWRDEIISFSEYTPTVILSGDIREKRIEAIYRSNEFSIIN